MLATPPAAAFRTFGSRVLIALTVFTLMAVAGFGYGNWFIADRWGSTDEVKLLATEGNETVIVNGKRVRVFNPTKPANYLIIGSDSRKFVDDPGEEVAFGDPNVETGARSDTLMVAHVDPNDENHGYLVSFPRDLLVTIPGQGENRINSAFDQGPDAVIQTLKQNFDISIQYYLEVDFQGFKDIVDAIGTVRIYFPTGARDEFTGLNITIPGCWKLPGDLALAYARSRHYEYKESATSDWKTDQTSDLGRIRRQQYFIRSLFKEAADRAGADPRKALRIVNDVVPNITRSDNLGVPEMMRLVRTFRNVDPGAVLMETVPADREITPDGKDALRMNAVAAAPILQRLRTFAPVKDPSTPKTTTTIPETPAADISILVQNGSGVGGVARATNDALAAQGFPAAAPAADADRKDYANTLLRYAPGHEGDALVVRSYLGGVGQLEEIPGLISADVVVVIGADFAGTTDRGARATTTTSASTTSTLPPNPGTFDPANPNPLVVPTEPGVWVGCPPGSEKIYEASD